MAEVLEVKTYRQSSGTIITLRRFDTGYERLVNGLPQAWGTGDDKHAKFYMADFQNFEEKIGSEVL